MREALILLPVICSAISTIRNDHVLLDSFACMSNLPDKTKSKACIQYTFISIFQALNSKKCKPESTAHCMHVHSHPPNLGTFSKRFTHLIFFVGLPAKPAVRMRTRQVQRGPHCLTSPSPCEDPDNLSDGTHIYASHLRCGYLKPVLNRNQCQQNISRKPNDCTCIESATTDIRVLWSSSTDTDRYEEI